MLRLPFIAVASLLTLATAAHAGVATEHIQRDRSPIIQVGEGCGRDFWRGPGGHCNPFGAPYGGSNRGTPYECPGGWHFVQGGAGRCFPNR